MNYYNTALISTKKMKFNLCLLSLLLCHYSYWGVDAEPEQSNCERELPYIAEYEYPDGAFVGALRETSPDATPVVLAVNYTCLAQGPSEGQYRALSVIITYFDLNELGLPINVAHLQLLCYSFEWVQPSDDVLENITDSVVALETRFDCRSCRAGGNEHHCIRKSDDTTTS